MLFGNNVKFYENPSSGSGVVCYMRIDKWTNGRTGGLAGGRTEKET